MLKIIVSARKLSVAFMLLGLLAITGVVFAKGGAPRVANLTGAAEVGGGDLDGSGSAEITLNVGQGTVCWELTVADIAPAFAAHIHAAPAGVNGGVVVPLSAPTNGSSSGCAQGVDKELIKEIIATPEQFYVNVHNADFPGGALRGQLSNRGHGK